MDNQFILYVLVSGNTVKTKLIDTATNEEYVLHLIDAVSGAFVGLIRTNYKQVLNNIAEKCFDTNIFKNEYTQKVIEYVRQKYNDELEFLWEKYPSNAIWRRKDTKKWYCALLVLSKRKLYIESDEVIDILDLRVEPEELKSLIDNKKYFAGYHMNKQHWCTICLDGSIALEEVFGRIDNSYALALK